MRLNASEEISAQEIRRGTGFLVTLAGGEALTLPCLLTPGCDVGVARVGLGSLVDSRISPKERLGDIVWLEGKVCTSIWQIPI